jgi:transcription initiation factor TFIIH subunit 3
VINKLKIKTPKSVKSSSRICVFFNSEMDTHVFSKLMSCVFVLEHREIALDVLVLDEKAPDYLLQATQKTKGICLAVPKLDRGLIQYIMQALVISKSQRDSFKMPYLTKTNFSGSCTCHNAKTELAWVCSVCLGVYCQKGRQQCRGKCDFCGEKYDICDFNQLVTTTQ